MNTIQFRIINLTCEACSKVCTILIKKIPGVQGVTIDPKTGITSVETVRPVDLGVIREQLEKRKYKLSTLSI